MVHRKVGKCDILERTEKWELNVMDRWTELIQVFEDTQFNPETGQPVNMILLVYPNIYYNTQICPNL